MFRKELVKQLLDKHRSALADLNRIEAALREDFHKLEAPVHAIILAAASGEPLLFVGPPGAAKSALIRRFCEYLHIGREDGYFEYLLTPFTEPGELFGFYDIREFYRMAAPNGAAEGTANGMARRGIPRLSQHMLQEAQIAFLDEVFNGSSAILNSLLTLMNERLFFDQGERTELGHLHCVFAATNQAPATAELRAIFDRFLIRCEIGNVRPDPTDVFKLLEKGLRADAKARPPFQIDDLLGRLRRLAADVRGLGRDPTCLHGEKTGEICRALAQKIALDRQNASAEAASNRRVVRSVRVMLVNQLLRLAAVQSPTNFSFADEDVSLFDRYFTDRLRDRMHEALLGEFH